MIKDNFFAEIEKEVHWTQDQVKTHNRDIIFKEQKLFIQE